MQSKNIKISQLDLAIVADNTSISATLNNSKMLAQWCEKLGYERFWMAEHHNMVNVASSATSVLLTYIASHTEKIRVGSGGVMLPNHSPLIIAEQFGTLESLFPNRIDLGLGRAPGSDSHTSIAIRSDFFAQTKRFPENIVQLQKYLSDDNQYSNVRAFPGEGTNVPLWILGSSTDSAYLAASLGLPYAFAGHFAPRLMLEAFQIYKQNYRPNDTNPRPYTMACVNVIGADSNEEAELLSCTLYANFLNIIRNTRQPMKAPSKAILESMNDMEKAQINQMLGCTFVGNKETLQNQLADFVETSGIDELMITSHIYDFEKRLHSTQLAYEAVAALNAEKSKAVV
ncbi:luciferase family oxidoreductase, group 1 [Flexibacter flexilis DSM 6793]|uniref:Luciferase-like monooxygenase n=1 Tax=Flexibacter flexilis DSM 6793 TaxID=927664 RepID=A0A1I1DQ79_9BACT|nr:LLM class flavin-dependent oxidoreductase [Flexibacter flexilis]SFB75188.1 luciferase family oxidoreductase, group 1 [Flexibacter flexilis DSM 6793]